MANSLISNVQTTIDNVRLWGAAKGITGPDGKATKETQFDKLLEEVWELQEGIEANDREEIKDAIGDCTVVLILLANLCNMSFEQCLESAYDVISKRTGKMIDGQFVKDQ